MNTKKLILWISGILIVFALLLLGTIWYIINYQQETTKDVGILLILIFGIFCYFLPRAVKKILTFNRFIYTKIVLKHKKFFIVPIVVILVMWVIVFLAIFKVDSERELPTNNGIDNESIGIATMTEDGTIILDLRAQGTNGTIGDGRLTYPKTHKDYQDILDHLGGLRPGEQKSVRPWPDSESPP